MSEPSCEPPIPERRRALQWAAFFLGGLATAAAGIPIVGYVLGVLIRPRRDEWISLGLLSQFPEGQTRLVDLTKPGAEPWDGMARKTAAYVRRMGPGDFRVLAVNCAHLGCPVSWFPQAGLFLCPCHGGVYYEDGSYASGPPPRGLYGYDYRFVDPAQGNQVVPPEQVAALPPEQHDRLALQVFGGHLPTLQDPLRQSGKEAKG